MPPYSFQTGGENIPDSTDNDIAKKMMAKKEKLAEARANFVNSMDRLNEELVLLKAA